MAWDDVKYLYHKLVLNPALESVKANRFYQTCPLCETCFKVVHSYLTVDVELNTPTECYS